MTEISGANDSSDFDGNTIVLECEYNEYINISGCEFYKFKTDDKIKDYISFWATNCVLLLLPLEKNIHFSYQIFISSLKTIKSKKDLY